LIKDSKCVIYDVNKDNKTPLDEAKRDMGSQHDEDRTEENYWQLKVQVFFKIFFVSL